MLEPKLRDQDKHYVVAAKNNWRQRCWRDIAKRVKQYKNPKSALAFYLPATDDHDRKVAVKRGFNPTNLIGVERDPKVVRHLRKQGKIVVSGDLLDVIPVLPEGYKADVVFADLLGGLNTTAFTQVSKLWRSNGVHEDTVFAINMLRGRERGEDTEYINLIRARHKLPHKKHRGELLYLMWFEEMVTVYFGGDDPNIPVSVSGGQRQWFFKNMWESTKPKFFSYKSAAGHMRYDTLILNLGFSISESPSARALREAQIEQYPEIKQAAKDLSAAMAIRTMRNNGKLAPSPAS
jgi:hypothetical protein